MIVPNLRSPHDEVGGLVYFGRMVDKIRLKISGDLPDEYRENLGSGFDGRCSDFLGIDYKALEAQVAVGGDDEFLLEWAKANGRRPGEEEVAELNRAMRNYGRQDDATPRLQQRKAESGFSGREDIRTMFDYIDADEGRPVRA